MIPLVKPFIASSEVMMPEIEKILYSGYIAEGEKVYEFERSFGEYVDNPNVLSLNSGTAALHIALMLAGVGPDDEVISTALTAEPTNVAIKLVGAKVVWADVDPATGLIAPQSIRQKISPRTKAIIVVHYAGMVCDMDRINAIAADAGIPVIEDAAHAMGSGYNGKQSKMSFIKRTFRPIYHFFLLLRILNVHKTIYINLKYLPWGQALRFPIFVFGRLKIQRSDNGGIEIRHARICRGMIKIGKNIDGHYSHNLPVELILSQKLIFQGYAWISGGTMIETYRGTIDIGNFCVIGSGTMLKSESGIILGNLTRIAYCSTIMDTNVHFIKNTKTGKVNNSSAPISIGIGCWINAFSFISKPILKKKSLEVIYYDFDSQDCNANIVSCRAKFTGYTLSTIQPTMPFALWKKYPRKSAISITPTSVMGEPTTLRSGKPSKTERNIML
ncbi:hypothetical protein KML24007_00010 [Alistipes indistinctus]|uniref:aminotransferase class V-fold PLP-dependent enzyme n=1 Tax=Alistipes indistinctus TaxID=626932 RepID=UPI0036F42647